MYYRRSREEMPARAEEIEEAQEEGVEFYFCASPRRFEERDGHLFMETYVMRLCAPDESGRRRPEIIPGAGFEAVSYTHLDVYKRQEEVRKLSWVREQGEKENDRK